MSEFTLIKNVHTRWGHDVDGKFVTLVNVVVEGSIHKGMYKFIVQPEFCTHASCGFKQGQKVDNRLVKPKCTYQSWRKATSQELSNPDIKDAFIAVHITYIRKDAEQRWGLGLFSIANEKFVDGLLQDGGNERLIVSEDGKPGWVDATNYNALVEKIKKAI